MKIWLKIALIFIFKQLIHLIISQISKTNSIQHEKIKEDLFYHTFGINMKIYSRENFIQKIIHRNCIMRIFLCLKNNEICNNKEKKLHQWSLIKEFRKIKRMAAYVAGHCSL